MMCKCGLDGHLDQMLHVVGSRLRLHDPIGECAVIGHCDDGRAMLETTNGEVHTFHHLDSYVIEAFDAPELSIMICLARCEPDIQINDTLTAIPFGDFAESPMLAKFSTEQATVWAAQLRLVAQQLDDLAAEMQPQVCFPTTGMEEV